MPDSLTAPSLMKYLERRSERALEQVSRQVTYIRSAFWMVDSRCAMAIVVRPFAALSSASCTTFSEFESSADVASSSSNTFGLRSRARAMAIRSVNVRQNRTVVCTSERHTLLSPRELRTLAPDLGVKAPVKKRSARTHAKEVKENVLWQALNEVQDVSITARGLDLLLRDFRLRFGGTEKDVQSDRARV